MRVSDGKLWPFLEIAVTYIIYWVLGFRFSRVWEVTVVSEAWNPGSEVDLKNTLKKNKETIKWTDFCKL